MPCSFVLCCVIKVLCVLCWSFQWRFKTPFLCVSAGLPVTERMGRDGFVRDCSPGGWSQCFHQSVRMHIASVGISKVCFLFSLALCGLLFLLIPALKPPAPHVDWPRPRAQVRPQQRSFSDGPAVTVTSHRLQNADSTTRFVISLAGQKDETKRKKDEKNVRQENAAGLLRHRGQDLLVLEDIFIAVKTTRKYHMSRLELLIKTWISQAKEHVRSFRITSSWWLRLSLRPNLQNL